MSSFATIIRIATFDVIKDIILFPWWWYTTGLSRMWHRFLQLIFSWQYRIGLGIWVKNWLRPMYAQFDWQGRLISFVMRTIIIIWKTIIFFVGFFGIIALFIGYCIAPVALIGLLAYDFLV